MCPPKPLLVIEGTRLLCSEDSAGGDQACGAPGSAAPTLPPVPHTGLCGDNLSFSRTRQPNGRKGCGRSFACPLDGDAPSSPP